MRNTQLAADYAGVYNLPHNGLFVFQDFDHALDNNESQDGWACTSNGSPVTVQTAQGSGIVTTTLDATTEWWLIKQPDAPFILGAGDTVWFGGRFKTSDASHTAFYFGVAEDETEYAANTPANGVMLTIAAGSATLTVYEGSTTPNHTSSAVFTMADNTWATIEVVIEMDASVASKGTIKLYKDKILILTQTVTGLPDTAALKGFYEAKGHGTGTSERIVSTDFIYFWQRA